MVDFTESKTMQRLMTRNEIIIEQNDHLCTDTGQVGCFICNSEEDLVIRQSAQCFRTSPHINFS